MLLFQKRFHAGLLDGSIRLTFRRWSKPLVRPGGRYRCHPIGVLEVDAIERVTLRAITDEDARRAGFTSRPSLVDYLREGPGGPIRAGDELFKVTLHHAGDGDRIAIALDARLGPDDVADIASRLDRLDARSPDGPWTTATLALIEEMPRIAASRLAAVLGREKVAFKADVVKLKKLGLTQSFEVGYEISPRGRAYRKAVARTRRSSARS